jgi:hypothetical protein
MIEERLQKKPLAKKSVGVVQISGANKKETKSNEDKSSKKIRKE